jgi:adenine-specific DNA-methyltransferase
MRFLGNKTRMLANIRKVIIDNKIDGNIFCDLFAGSSCVGDYFKGEYKIISNEYLRSLSVISHAKLNNSATPQFKNFRKTYGANDPFEFFNAKQYKADHQYFITNNYSPKGGRMFFTEENATKIDGIRIDLEQMHKDLVFDIKEYKFLLASLLESVMGVSNTTGTYEAYLKHWDKRALKKFALAPLVLNKPHAIVENEIHNEDSNELIRKQEISGDILYIDPPYTVTEYNSAYHLLESIAKYDYPTISGITGRRQDKNNKSKYTRKEQALKNFEDLFRQAQFKHVLVSYSTQGLVSAKELENIAKRFALNNEVKIFEFPFREYKNIRTSQKGDDLKEILLYFKKDNEVIKSPLNYTGSKYSIMNDITKVMPKHISTFVDIMGGAFNVGANVIAENIVYNEFLPHTFELIKILLKDNKQELMNKITKIVAEYELKKTEKEPYLKLREAYNKTKDIYRLFVLHMYCFQNQMRFNSSLEFNSPVGNCSYNETIDERIKSFIPKTKNYELINGSYELIDIKKYDKDTIFYFDPPYFITSATYNDGKRGFIGWDADEETKLMKFIVNLNNNGYKFILSNVMAHGDQINNILRDIVRTHGFTAIPIYDVGSKNSRDEVLITNFNWRKS